MRRVWRQRRVTELWNWLPAFRAVAEREHVKQAARDLHITPSALSRSIHLLEQSLGKPLFDRVGRNLRLNQEGAAFLAAVRDGMRGIDDGVARITSTEFVGELRIACDGDHPLDFVWRAVVRLRREYPFLVPIVDDGRSGDLAAQLFRGDLDVAFVAQPFASQRARVESLGCFTYGIYCGDEHPLGSHPDPHLDTILRHAFVAPTPRSASQVGDNWPADVERTVEVYLPSLESALRVCASGHLLAVLPDAAVHDARARYKLHRLRSDVVPPSRLYAVSRKAVGNDASDRAAALIAHVKRVIAERAPESTAPPSHSALSHSASARAKARRPTSSRRSKT